MPVFMAKQSLIRTATHPNAENQTEPRENKEEYEHRIGTAILQENGGYVIYLYVLPINGKLLMRPPLEIEEKDPTLEKKL